MIAAYTSDAVTGECGRRRQRAAGHRHGVAERAYLAMINDQGGINGRKINLVNVDDGSSPPKTFEQTRKLVEQDEVAFIFSNLGTPSGIVVRKYLNERKIPQRFQASGATLSIFRGTSAGSRTIRRK